MGNPRTEGSNSVRMLPVHLPLPLPWCRHVDIDARGEHTDAYAFMTSMQAVRPDNRDENFEQLTERFTRLFGRRPTETELARFQRARTGLEMRLPAQVRRAAATLITAL